MKENQASKENRKDKKHKNGPILLKMNFTMQMKVGNCSLDQNPRGAFQLGSVVICDGDKVNKVAGWGHK